MSVHDSDVMFTLKKLGRRCCGLGVPGVPS